jgi:hypothetical protein
MRKTLSLGGGVFSVQDFLPMAEQYNLRLLCEHLFDYSKRLAFIAFLFRILVFLVGAIFVLFALSFPALPFFIALLSLLAELLQWRSDTIKGTSESILRNLEFRDSLGWAISSSMLSDILATISIRIRAAIKNKQPQKQYFSSTQQNQLLMALENLQESAWHSKHLANRMGQIYFVISTIIVFLSIVALLWSIETIRSFVMLQNISRVVTATIMLIFSLRFVRLTADYYSFSRRSQQVESTAEQLVETSNLVEIQVVRLFHEYQLLRASSPLIPTWVWRSMNSELNTLWKNYRVSSQSRQKPM